MSHLSILKVDVNVGISPLAVRVMNILLEENRLPIKLANYYLAEDFQEPSSQSNVEISFQSHQLKCVEIHK